METIIKQYAKSDNAPMAYLLRPTVERVTRLVNDSDFVFELFDPVISTILAVINLYGADRIYDLPCKQVLAIVKAPARADHPSVA